MKKIAAFITVILAVRMIRSYLVVTDAAAKSLALEQNLASLAADVASLQAGLFSHGITLGGDVLLNGHNISNVSEINTGGQTWGGHGDFFMNGNNIHMQGGSVIP